MAVEKQGAYDPAKEPYYFSFGRNEDDSEVRIIGQDKGATWQHTTEGLRAGHERAISFGPGGDGNGEAWLFSRSFKLKANHDYEAGIVYRYTPDPSGSRPKDTGRDFAAPRLRLRLGEAQKPEAQKQLLIDWAVMNTEFQPVKVAFRVPKDGIYYFSLQGQTGGIPGSVTVSDNGVATMGQMRGF